MGCRIIVGKKDGADDDNCAVLYDSVTGTAFGPLFEDYEEADLFMEWLAVDETRQRPSESGDLTADPRVYKGDDLAELLHEFRQTIKRDE